MKETLRDAVEDVRQKLCNGLYEKEEHIRLSLVARICRSLGWDVWNPQEFYTEHYIKVKGFKGLVDVALFSSTMLESTPDVFIEVKYLGSLTRRRLKASLEKLEEYNRKKTASFTVLTDGQYWLFYDSSAKGELYQKHFLTIDILSSNTNKIEKDLTTFLSKAMYPDKAPNKAKISLTKIKISTAVQSAKSQVKDLMHKYPNKNAYEVAREYLMDHNQDIDVKTIIKYWDKDISPFLPFAEERGNNPLGKRIVKPDKKSISSKNNVAKIEITGTDKKRYSTRIDDNYTGTDVVSIQLQGNKMYPASWKEAKRLVYTTLLAEIKNVKLTKWYGISQNRSNYSTPIDLGDGYFTEGNLGANNVVKHCYRVLEALDMNPQTDLIIETKRT